MLVLHNEVNGRRSITTPSHNIITGGQSAMGVENLYYEGLDTKL